MYSSPKKETDRKMIIKIRKGGRDNVTASVFESL